MPARPGWQRSPAGPSAPPIPSTSTSRWTAPPRSLPRRGCCASRTFCLGAARALARDGWDLALCGVRPEADVVPVLESLRKDGAAVHYIAADLASPRERRRLVDQVHVRLGAINALVNNAGRAPRVRADLLEATEDSFEELVRTNLQGPYFLTQAIAPGQPARRPQDPALHAPIVFTTSVS